MWEDLLVAPLLELQTKYTGQAPVPLINKFIHTYDE